MEGRGSVTGGGTSPRQAASSMIRDLQNAEGQTAISRPYSQSTVSTLRRAQPVWAHPGINAVTFDHLRLDLIRNVIEPRMKEYQEKLMVEQASSRAEIAKTAGVEWISSNPKAFHRICYGWTDDLGLTVREDVPLDLCPEADRQEVQMTEEDLRKATAINMVASNLMNRAYNKCQQFHMTDEKRLEALFDYLDPEIHNIRDLSNSADAQLTPEGEQTSFAEKEAFVVQQLRSVHGSGQGLPTVLFYALKRNNMTTTITSFMVQFKMRAEAAHVPIPECNQRFWILGTAPWTNELIFDAELKKDANLKSLPYRCAVNALKLQEMADIIETTEQTHQLVVSHELASNPHLIDVGDPSNPDPRASQSPAATNPLALPKNSAGYTACVHCWADSTLNGTPVFRYHSVQRCPTVKKHRRTTTVAESSSATPEAQSLTAAGTATTFTCYNCGDVGHRWANCTHPLRPEFVQLQNQRSLLRRIFARPSWRSGCRRDQ